MAHMHSHSENFNKAFAIGVTLNIIFVIIEVIYGMAAGSLALLADAGHNFSDVLGLLLAWGANRLATVHPTEKRTYGFKRATIIASLLSAILLLVAMGGIAWEAFGRLFNPQEVEGKLIIVVAAIGVVINTATAMLFMSGQKTDLNIKAAYLHMAADAGVSLGVVIIGIAILLTGWIWLDPVISLLIVVVILISTWGLFRDSLNLSLDAVPENIDILAVRRYLNTLENVTEIHDLHIWAISTTVTALTVHLVVDDEGLADDFLQTVRKHLQAEFSIEHATIQVENERSAETCKFYVSE